MPNEPLSPYRRELSACPSARLKRRMLPPYQVLADLYLGINGKPMSWAKIAAKYDFPTKTIYNKMVRHAKSHGLEWPLDTKRKKNTRVWDSVDVEMVLLEVKDLKKRTGMSYREMSKRLDLNRNHFAKITAGWSPRISRVTATKIMNMVTAVEKEYGLEAA